MVCICEYCGKEFTEDYRSNKNLSTARFCSKSCKAKFNGKKNKGVIGHKNYFTGSFINYDINKACPYCNKEFIKYFSYKGHVGQCANNPKRILKKEQGLLVKSDSWKESMKNRKSVKQNHNPNNDVYYCSHCNRQFSRKESRTLHEKYCEYNPNKIDNPRKGKPHTEEQNSKNRKAVIEKYEKIGIAFCPNVSIKGCNYIDDLNLKFGWNLQHGLNGGEVEIDGYFLDGYDKERNIVFEYDEPFHYKDIENNILEDKDIKRQQYLIKKLNCDFYRYNEKKNYFYKVN